MMKTLLCAAAFAVAPIVAAAATVAPGATGSVGGILNGTPLSFSFEPTETLTFNFVVTALAPLSSLNAITYGFSPDIAQSVALNSVVGSEVFAVGIATPAAYTSNTPFSVYFFGNGGGTNSTIALSYATEGAFVPAPVPLPAAGGLLALALVGMGGAAARRRKA